MYELQLQIKCVRPVYYFQPHGPNDFSQSQGMESGCDGYSQQSTETCIKRTVHSKEASNFNISCAITVCNFSWEQDSFPHLRSIH